MELKAYKVLQKAKKSAEETRRVTSQRERLKAYSDAFFEIKEAMGTHASSNAILETLSTIIARMNDEVELIVERRSPKLAELNKLFANDGMTWVEKKNAWKEFLVRLAG